MKQLMKDNLLKCYVIHRLPGRLRISYKGLKYLSNYKEQINQKIKDYNGIESITLNFITQTILILHDKKIQEEALLEYIDQIFLEYKIYIYKECRVEAHKEVHCETTEETTKDIAIRLGICTGALAASRLGKNIPLITQPFIKGNILGKLTTSSSLISLFLVKNLFENGIVGAVKNRSVNADTLTLTSIVSSLLLGKSTSALTIIMLSDVAELLTTYTQEKTRKSIKKMLQVDADFVWQLNEKGVVTQVPIDKVNVNDEIIVYTGEKISVDGHIVAGEGIVDESSITGEFFPAVKKKDSTVFAGSVVTEGSLTIKVEKVGDDTVVSRIINLVENVATQKAPIQHYADKFSNYLVPLNFLLSGVVYLSTKDSVRALNMLVIDYSCGIKLSTATAFSAAINSAVKNGVLVKGGNFLEVMADADTMIFDKTGTLTEGRPNVTSVHTVETMTEREVVALASAVEKTSSHPLAYAIVEYGKLLGCEEAVVQNSEVIVSRGIKATINEEEILVGNKALMKEHGVAKLQELQGENNAIIVYIAKARTLIGVLSIKDKVRSNMRRAANKLRNKGIAEILLLTGDVESQAKEVAKQIGVDSYEAELLPKDKGAKVLDLQSKGAKVIMVGDGINDAPALAYADVGIALGGKSTDVAMETADITITTDNPMMLPAICDLSKQTMDIVKQNFGLVIGVNSVGLLLSAVGGISVFGGAILHNMSTILVVGNSIRLLFHKLERGEAVWNHLELK